MSYYLFGDKNVTLGNDCHKVCHYIYIYTACIMENDHHDVRMSQEHERSLASKDVGLTKCKLPVRRAERETKTDSELSVAFFHCV